MSNRQLVLKSRPKGVPSPDNFELKQVDVPQVNDGDVLVKTLYISVDPYMRSRLDENKKGNYVTAFDVGSPMFNFIAGVVAESKSPDYKKGDYVTGILPFQDFNLVTKDKLGETLNHVPAAVQEGKIPLSVTVGALGMPGLTAYFGLLNICEPQEGQTLLVSGAAGAVGMSVGQIGKIKGCRVVGIAGTDEKCKFIKEELGFDEAINYKTAGDLTKAVAAACPDGVDMYFDNVGGEALDAAMLNMNVHARIAVCGAISQYNETQIPQGPRLSFTLVQKQAKMQGFLVFSYYKNAPQAVKEMSEWILQGKLKYRETVVEGFEKIPEAFIGLFTGTNTGKMVIKVNEE